EPAKNRLSGLKAADPGLAGPGAAAEDPAMTGRARVAAWTLSAVAIALFALGVALAALGTSTGGPDLGPLDIAVFGVLLTYAVVGALVAGGRPDNPIGWLLLAEGLLFQLVCFSIGYTHHALYAEPGSLLG